MSPLASPAGVAQTPDAPPVGSGHGGGFLGSSLVAVKYPGNFGAGAAAAAGAPGAAGAAAGASAFAGSGAFASSAAKDNPVNKIIHSPMAKDARIVLFLPRFIFPPPLSLFDTSNCVWPFLPGA